MFKKLREKIQLTYYSILSGGAMATRDSLRDSRLTDSNFSLPDFSIIYNTIVYSIENTIREQKLLREERLLKAVENKNEKLVSTIKQEIRDLKETQKEILASIEKLKEKSNTDLYKYITFLTSLVSDAKYKEVFDDLSKKLKPRTSSFKEFVAIKSRFNKVEKDYIKGLIEHDKYEVIINKITLSLLELFNSLKESDFKKD